MNNARGITTGMIIRFESIMSRVANYIKEIDHTDTFTVSKAILLKEIGDNAIYSKIKLDKIVTDKLLSIEESINTGSSITLDNIAIYIAYTGVSKIHLPINDDDFRFLRTFLANAIISGTRLGDSIEHSLKADKAIKEILVKIVSSLDGTKRELINNKILSIANSIIVQPNVIGDVNSIKELTDTDRVSLINILTCIAYDGRSPVHLDLSKDEFKSLRQYAKIAKIPVKVRASKSYL